MGVCGGRSPLETVEPEEVMYIQMCVIMDKEKTGRGRIRGLNLAAVRPSTVQLTN
jgi:hypothetical protein